jgi:hypothetical protein
METQVLIRVLDPYGGAMYVGQWLRTISLESMSIESLGPTLRLRLKAAVL